MPEQTPMPDLTPIFAETLNEALDMFEDNLTPVIGLFSFYLALRFAPSLLSWYRHRNDPKQLSMF